MTEQATAARKAYKKEWAQKNPEKVKAYQDRYWAKRAAEMNAKKDDEKQDVKEVT